MTTARAILLALATAATIGAAAHFAGGIPAGWAVLVALPVGAAVLLAGLLSDVFDVDWAPEPASRTASVCSHATSLTDQLTQAAADPHRFTARIQPRLRRLALDTVRRTAGVTDLDDPRARELLGADLHDLLTARDAHLPPPTTFAAMVRRLEEP